MSCKGLKGSALKNCMAKYRKESKRVFPNFNQQTDTVVTRRSNSVSGLAKMNSRLTENTNAQTVITKGKGKYPYTSRTLLKKQ
jgi:hypothetical protein